MKKLAFFVETLNPFVKVFLMIATAPIGIIAIPILSQMAQNERINNILNNPTEKNVIILMEKCRVFTITQTVGASTEGYGML